MRGQARARWWLGAMVSFLASGCFSPSPPPGVACAEVAVGDHNCPSGQACIGGFCAVDCTGGCDPGFTCDVTSTCQRVPPELVCQVNATPVGDGENPPNIVEPSLRAGGDLLIGAQPGIARYETTRTPEGFSAWTPTLQSELISEGGAPRYPVSLAYFRVGGAEKLLYVLGGTVDGVAFPNELRVGDVVDAMPSPSVGVSLLEDGTTLSAAAATGLDVVAVSDDLFITVLVESDIYYGAPTRPGEPTEWTVTKLPPDSDHGKPALGPDARLLVYGARGGLQYRTRETPSEPWSSEGTVGGLRALISDNPEIFQGDGMLEFFFDVADDADPSLHQIYRAQCDFVE